MLGDIRASQTGMGDQTVIDASGRRLSTFPSALFSGDVEIERGDLARILYDRSTDVAEYVFGNHITGMTQDADGVDVTFAHGAPRRFDLVVGADGLHSAVRRLAFGEESRFRHDLGLAVAGFDVPNTFGLDHGGLIYNEPGRFVMVTSGRDRARAAVCLMFTSVAAGLRLARHRRPEANRGGAFRRCRLAGAGLARGAAGRAGTVLRHDQPDPARPLVGRARGAARGRGLVHRPRRQRHRARHARRVHARRGTGAGGRRPCAPRTGVTNSSCARRSTKSQKTAAGAGRFLTPATERRIRNRNRTFRILSSRAMTRAVRLAGEADHQYRIPAGLPASWLARPGPGRPAVTPLSAWITRGYRLRATPPHMADRAAAGRAVGTVTACGRDRAGRSVSTRTLSWPFSRSRAPCTRCSARR